MKDILLVGAGSFFGGIARYAVSLVYKWGGAGFPVGTFLVNIAGCFLIGLCMALLGRHAHLNLLLSVGFCGGFTTFSTFSKESLQLLEAGDYLTFILYLAGSVVLGIGAVMLGFMLGRG
ncbi:MAG: fluoride efflux transporter CrcB [Prevotella sp.]|nr:fluoride efflux transporter CrcB [Prevotella sp.]